MVDGNVAGWAAGLGAGVRLGATEKILGTGTPFLSEEYHNIAFLSHHLRCEDTNTK